MNSENYSTKNEEFKDHYLQNDMNYHKRQSSDKSKYPMYAGILLMIASITSLIYWIFVVFNADFFISMADISYLESIDPSITIESIKQTLVMCGTIFCIVSIFPLLGAILSLKKKLWGIALACSIIGIFSIGAVFLSSILSLISLILLIIAKNEFNEAQT